MNKQHFDQFDLLLNLAASELLAEETEAFLKIEITDPPNPRFVKRLERFVYKQARREKHPKRHKFLKTLAVACLIALGLIFTACVSIPKVRNFIVEAVVEWYDDFVAIQFVPSDITDQPKDPEVTTEEETTQPEPPKPFDPPKTIEQINAPTIVFDGYTVTTYTTSTNLWQEFYDASGNYAFCFSQDPKGTKYGVDNGEMTLISIKINDLDAVLALDDEHTMTLVWEDSYYAYCLHGNFKTQEEAIAIASSVIPLK